MPVSQEELIPLREDERHVTRLHQGLTVLLGQLLALLVTSTGTFSQLLASRGVNVPTVQSFLNYVSLSALGLLLLRRRTPLKVPWWQYAVVAFFDVEGNYLMVLAYQYTTITSVQLLDCATIFMVMALSRVLFKTVYSYTHLLSTALCLLGLVLLVVSDLLSSRYAQDGSKPWLGDLLVLLGCAGYAVSNVFQEHAVKSYDIVEYLAMLGLFGSLVSGVQILILEREAVMSVTWDVWVCVYMGGFVVSLWLLYVLTPLLIRRSSAVFLNLSLLTADFWSLVVATCIFGASLSALYFVAFACIVGGLVVFNVASWSEQPSGTVSIDKTPRV